MDLKNCHEGVLKTNGIDIHFVEKGEGPLVIFCHGWPESWYSWRHQIEAIGTNGFRAVALHASLNYLREFVSILPSSLPCMRGKTGP